MSFRSRAFRRTLAIAAPAAFLAMALAPAAAQAARPGDPQQRPPREMSEIGGELLGRPGTQVRPERGAPELPDRISARSWIVADAESGEVLASHNAHWPRPPASTIKMLFADTVMPDFERDEVYRTRPEDFAEMGAGSSAVGLDDGSTYTVEDLWHGALLASGNDAVYALTAMNGGRDRTVAEMNERARELQARDTHVVNPDGYDADGQTSSAYDLTLFARSAMQNADFREYVSRPTAQFPGAGRGENRETYEIQSTNRLLVGDDGLDPYPGIAGVKNGYTSAAGYTFTGVAERGDRVLLVTCMDPDGDGLEVYRETAALFDWGFGAAGRVDPVGELVPPRGEAEEAQQAEEAEEAEQQGHENGGNGERAPGGADGAAGAVGEAGAAEPAGDGDSVGAGPVLAFTAAGLAVLAAGAYAFHRRHPLPLPRSRSGPAHRRGDDPAP